MAILSLVQDSSILENNIVQTVASAAGTLSAIIFVLPGLVIVGWWTGFPFWQSFLDLRQRRHPRRDVHHPAAARAGDDLRPAVSGRRRRRRSAEGRLRHGAARRKDDAGEAREGLDGRRPRIGRLGRAGHRARHAYRGGGVRGFFRIWRAASPAATASRGRWRSSAPAISSACRSAWPC